MISCSSSASSLAFGALTVEGAAADKGAVAVTDGTIGTVVGTGEDRLEIVAGAMLVFANAFVISLIGEGVGSVWTLGGGGRAAAVLLVTLAASGKRIR